MNGTMMGYTKKEMDAKLQDILDFAEIGDFVYQPVKTYSSGMFVRLAFALAIWRFWQRTRTRRTALPVWRFVETC